MSEEDFPDDLCHQRPSDAKRSFLWTLPASFHDPGRSFRVLLGFGQSLCDILTANQETETNHAGGANQR